MALARALEHLRAGSAQLAAGLIESHLAVHQADANAWHLLALAREDCGRREQALDCYDRALAEQPQFPDALHNRGLLLSRLGRFEAAEENFLRCVQSEPTSARAWSSLTDVQLALSKYDAAIESAKALIRLNEREPTAQIRLGLALACLRRFSEARQLFASARQRHPEHALTFISRVAGEIDPEVVLSPENVFLARQFAALGTCDWSRWEEYVAEMRAVARSSNAMLEPAIAFMAQHLPLSGTERHAIARHIAQHIEKDALVLPPPPPRTRNQLRIGILSPDFREHLNAYLLLPLFELADRRNFQLYAYSLSADDRTQARARVQAAADAFRDLHAKSDLAAAEAIRSDDIDILVDAAGYTAGGRFQIVARRPARLQVLYLGFSGSTGSSRVDYVIADRSVASEDAEWSESLAYLPHTWFLYDFRTPVRPTEVTRRDYGLPEAAFVYCAFHRAEKISPDVFELWIRILGQVPGSVLWLLALPEAAQRNLRKEAGKHDIDPSRLVFAPFEPRHGDRYLPRQRLGDLMLDTFYHNAMTTACDALGAGLPVLTLSGPALASRGGASLVRAAGVPELAVGDRESYVAQAVALARNPKRLAKYREELATREGPLFDTAARVRELEACFSRMMEDYVERAAS